MRKKPLIIQLIGWGLIISPLFYYIQSVIQWGFAFTDFKYFWENTIIFRLIGICLGPLVGYLVLQVRPMGWYAIIVYALYTVFVNFEIYARGDVSVPLLLAYCATGLSVAFVYFVHKEIMTPYFNPKLRWWESAQRVPLHLEVTFKHHDMEEVIRSKTFDISESGCFIETEHPFQLGEDLHFALKLESEIEMTGQVMWVSEGSNRVPKGIGIRFTSKNKEIKKMVKNFQKQYREFNPA